jgi:AraC family transcriptional regulator, regulatory protein of adaptative response / methylphosphotriester-DNA alkyltransferase methyltransferase
MIEEMWEAIIHCDPKYDGKFFYGVETTGIFCRPSCKSRNPKRENVRLFATIGEASLAKFRPCKRCNPDDMRWPDEDLAQHAVDLIHSRYPEALTLQSLSHMLHISPSHLHRTFHRIVGQTPAAHLRSTRLAAAQRLLVETETSITDVAVSVGFQNASHFSTVFHKQYGLSPSGYRQTCGTGSGQGRS